MAQAEPVWWNLKSSRWHHGKFCGFVLLNSKATANKWVWLAETCLTSSYIIWWQIARVQICSTVYLRAIRREGDKKWDIWSVLVVSEALMSMTANKHLLTLLSKIRPLKGTHFYSQNAVHRSFWVIKGNHASQSSTSAFYFQFKHSCWIKSEVSIRPATDEIAIVS